MGSQIITLKQVNCKMLILRVSVLLVVLLANVYSTPVESGELTVREEVGDDVNGELTEDDQLSDRTKRGTAEASKRKWRSLVERLIIRELNKYISSMGAAEYKDLKKYNTHHTLKNPTKFGEMNMLRIILHHMHKYLSEPAGGVDDGEVESDDGEVDDSEDGDA